MYIKNFMNSETIDSLYSVEPRTINRMKDTEKQIRTLKIKQKEFYETIEKLINDKGGYFDYSTYYDLFEILYEKIILDHEQELNYMKLEIIKDVL